MTVLQPNRRLPWAGLTMAVVVMPYLVLKGLWLSGNMLGIPAGSPARGGDFVVANVITALLDVAAIALAFALTSRWGRRIPGWMVLVPAWVGVGFLVPAVIGVPVGTVAMLNSGGEVGGLVEPWVYQMVYASFALQGVVLTLAFRGYAHRRWTPDVTSTGNPAEPHRVLLLTGAVLAGIVGLSDVAWTFGPTGPYGAYQDGWQFTARFGTGVEGALALAASVCAVMLSRSHRNWRVVTLAFVGSGTMFAYGLFRTMPVLAKMPAAADSTGWSNTVHFTGVLAGLTIAVTGALLLSTRPTPAASPAPAPF